MKQLDIVKNHLKENLFNLVVYKENKFHTSNKRGVLPLVELLESNINFRSASAADKVVGKATSFLYVLLGVKEVYADVISKPALKVLQENKIYVEYSFLVDNIINRKKDGICPFEEAVLNCIEPKEAYKNIINKLDELNIRKQN